MSSKLADMLQYMIEAGYTPLEIKEGVINVFDEYFVNKDALCKYASSSVVLSAFEFMIRYHNDDTFFIDLKQVLSCYRDAYKSSPESAMKIIVSTLEDFTQRENMMWTVKQNVPNENILDLFDKVLAYMNFMGDNLEIGVKHIITEIYALILLTSKGTIDYEKIQKYDFGVVIQNILDKGNFIRLLKPSMISIKLSDWRNIAYHHDYIIKNNKIVCTYGKPQNSFEITFEELRNYVHQIIKSSNVFNIARSIFILDNIDFAHSPSQIEQELYEFRKPLQIYQLRISLLSQGFSINKYSEDGSIIDIFLYDLRNDGSYSKDDLLKREIHSSQFLYHVWDVFRKGIIQIIYCDKAGKEIFTSSVSSEIFINTKDASECLSSLASHVKFRNLT